MAGNPPIEVVIPSDGRLAGVYLQAISAYAPHPNAAKLWMEFLYSDEGQIIWMKGYCHPDPRARPARAVWCRRTCRQAARCLRRRLPDRRAAGCPRLVHRRAVGCRRRRQHSGCRCRRQRDRCAAVSLIDHCSVASAGNPRRSHIVHRRILISAGQWRHQRCRIHHAGRRFTWAWLGLRPFFLFAIFFIFLPSASLFIDSFRSVEVGLPLPTSWGSSSRPSPNPTG